MELKNLLTKIFLSKENLEITVISGFWGLDIVKSDKGFLIYGEQWELIPIVEKIRKFKNIKILWS